MARITGLGGAFLYANDPEALAAWYAEHFGLETVADAESGARYREFVVRDWDEPRRGHRVMWAIVRAATPLPAGRHAVINYAVDDLDTLVAGLRAAGVTVDRVEELPYGRFAWVTDPEGNRLELCQDLDPPC